MHIPPHHIYHAQHRNEELQEHPAFLHRRAGNGFLERKTFQETVRNPVIDKHYLKCYDYPINLKERSELHAVPE